MQTVTSQDGTTIAFDKVGSGPAVILVNGALAYRAFDPSMAHLAELLGKHFTVYNYDRRGRGDSGDKEPFANEREIEDLQALVEDAGGKAMVFGLSSGGVVSLDAAAVTPGITKVGVYEPALIVDDSRQPVPTDYTEHLTTLAAQGKRDEAVEYFLTQAVGIPAEYIGGMKQDQATWSGMIGVAHTIAYDAAFVGTVMQGKPLPTDRWVKVTLPVLVADGGASDAWVHHAADALANVLPHASRQTLEAQTHMVDPTVLAPVIIEFFQQEQQTGVGSSRWHLLFLRQHGQVNVSVEGPLTKATPVTQAEGTEWFGVTFPLGTFLPSVPLRNLLDQRATLPLAAKTSFELAGSSFPLPDYDNVETFVQRLVREDVLVSDEIVKAVLAGRPPEVSLHTVRRRCLLATGLTYEVISQIERAKQAASLLGQGVSLLDTAYQAGYADQSHMTRALKHFIGYTPAHLARIGNGRKSE